MSILRSVNRKRHLGSGRILVSVVVFALLILGMSACKSREINPSKKVASGPPPPQFYDPANSIPVPADLRDASLSTIDGKTIKLSDYTGKVVILNLWATWCGPCREETPELITMSADYKDKGVQFIGIATKENESESGINGVKDFARGYKVPYEMVYTDNSFAGPLVGLVKGQSVIPQSFVISRDGKFVAHFQGFNPEQTPKKLRGVIDQAAYQAPPG